jgi:transposase
VPREGTVEDNVKRAEAARLAWPLGAEITDAVLKQRRFARAGVRPGVRRRGRTGLELDRTRGDLENH